MEKPVEQIHLEVVSALREFKLNRAVIERVNEIFGVEPEPTRVLTRNIPPLKAARDEAFFECPVAFDPDCEYFTVRARDPWPVEWLVGVPQGQGLSMALVKKSIQDRVKEVGFSKLPLSFPWLKFREVPKTPGAKVKVETALRNPGLYFGAYLFSEGGVKIRALMQVK